MDARPILLFDSGVGGLSVLAETRALLPHASFQGKGTGGTSRLVVDQATDTIVGATFTGFETADFLQAATVAIVAEVPRARLRHAIAPYPTRSEVWLKLLEKWEASAE